MLLRGLQSLVEREQRALSTALDRLPGVDVATAAGREDRPGTAVLLLRARGSFEHVSRETTAAIRSRMQATVDPRVRAHLSGYPDIGAGLHQRTVDAIHRAEMIAAPILLLVLLLVFRSPLAAAVPLAVGMGTVGAATGVLALVNASTPLDALALIMASMMGARSGSTTRCCSSRVSARSFAQDVTSVRRSRSPSGGRGTRCGAPGWHSSP